MSFTAVALLSHSVQDELSCELLWKYLGTAVMLPSKRSSFTQVQNQWKSMS